MFASNSSQVSSDAVFIEDVFSTYLYTGNGATRTITNGLDVSGKGGLVWIKNRSRAVDHGLYDTNRGALNGLASNSTTSQQAYSDTLTGFTSSGFTLGADSSNTVNLSNDNYASWTFRKQEKFFDVVTWTGDGTNNRQISHSLKSTPGCIIVKELNQTGSWYVYHTSNGTGKYMRLNATDTVTTAAAYFPAVSSTTFTPTSDTQLNTSSVTYVAYLFAHDAGGFGLSGTDNVISCGSFTTDSSGNASVNLGWEPQWVLTKMSTAATQWVINDNMRGMPASQTSQVLYPSLSAAESSSIYYTTQPNATGFTTQNYAGQPNNTVIYIAIRRGPMKTPTTGTSVLETTAYSGNNTANRTIGTSLTTDLLLLSDRQGTSSGWTNYAQYIFDRLRGEDVALATSNTLAESSGWANTYFNLDQQIGWSNGSNYNYLNSGVTTYASYSFRRAPSFMDVVCYTGTGADRTVTHNLGVAPELMIVKRRNDVENWYVYHAALGATKRLKLNLTDAEQTALFPWNNTAPTSTVFSLAGSVTGNGAGDTYVWYGFASCPGVSKVGSYTGTGTTLQINCGFTGGARFVLIKRTDSTGDWYVWDTARGIISGNDPYLLLNSTAAEVTNTDYIDAYSAGFEISSTAPAAINASGGTFIYLAIS